MQEPGLFDTPSVGELYAKEDARYMANTVGGRGSIEAGIGNLFNMGMQGLNRATGNEDEEIQKARKIQEVKKYVSENVQGGDMVTYYKGLADAFKKVGMMDEAYRVEMAIAKLEDADLDRQVKKDQIDATKEARMAAVAARLAGKPFEVEARKLLTSGKYTPESVGKYAVSGETTDLEYYDEKAGDELRETTEKIGDQTVRFLETWRKGKMIDKKRLTGDSINVSASSSSANLKDTKNEFDLVETAQKATKALTDSIQETDTALAMIAEPNGWKNEVVTRTLAKAFNNGSLSNADVKAFTNQGDVQERLTNAISLFLSGKLSDISQQQRKELLMLLRKKLKEQKNKQLEPYRASLKDRGFDPDKYVPAESNKEPSVNNDPLGIR